jgi:hypothetical protein
LERLDPARTVNLSNPTEVISNVLLRSLTESEKVPSAAVEVPVVLPTTFTEAPETGAPSAPETFPFTTVCANDDIAKNAIAQKPSRSFFLMQLIFVVNSNLSEANITIISHLRLISVKNVV